MMFANDQFKVLFCLFWLRSVSLSDSYSKHDQFEAVSSNSRSENVPSDSLFEMTSFKCLLQILALLWPLLRVGSTGLMHRD